MLAIGLMVGILLPKDLYKEQTQTIEESQAAFESTLKPTPISQEDYEKELWKLSQLYRQRTQNNLLCEYAKNRANYKKAFEDTTPHYNIREMVYTPIYNRSSIRYIGENIADGFLNPPAMFAGWLKSPTHKATLDDPIYTQSCIKCHYDKLEKAMYCVQLFAGY